MSRQNGRDLVLRDASQNAYAVATTKNFSVDNAPVDVTGDDDDAYMTLLERPATSQITADCTLVYDGDADVDLLMAALNRSVLLADQEIVIMDAATGQTPVITITLDLYLSNITITGASDGRIEATCSLQSSGAWEVTTT